MATPSELEVTDLGTRPTRRPCRLVALDGEAEILVGHLPVIVGRDGRCDVRLASLRVSRVHCCLVRAGDGISVRDLGSTNGIRINGRPVGSGWLRPGDLLAIAHLHFRLPP